MEGTEIKNEHNLGLKKANTSMFTKIISFVSAYLNQKPKSGMVFLDVLKEHLTVEQVTNQLTQKTIEKHQYKFNNIERWLIESKNQNLLVDDVKIKHMEDLRYWLHQNIKPCSLDHSSRHLRLCREAINFAVSREYVEYNPIHSVKLRRSACKEITSLELHEVKKFEKYHNKERPQWDSIRDLFLFQCFTGLSYVDLWSFQIVEDRGIYWVTCSSGRGKTKKAYWAEFIEKAKHILNKYNGSLPVVSNQTYNRSIKKIAKDIGIKKRLTTHIGRKTFATLKRHQGYSIPAISDMLGNTEEVTRKHYVSPGKELIINEMIRLKKVSAA